MAKFILPGRDYLIEITTLHSSELTPERFIIELSKIAAHEISLKRFDFPTATPGYDLCKILSDNHISRNYTRRH